MLTQQFQDFEPVSVIGSPHESDIELSGLQTGKRLDGILAVQYQTKIRKMRGDQRTQCRQNPDIGRRERTDGQVSCMSLCCLARQSAGVVDAAEYVSGLLQKDSAGVSQRDMVTTAIQQPDTDRSLELPNLLAQRRLGGVQFRRSTRKTQLFGNGNEVPQVPEFHASQLIVTHLRA